MTAEHQKSDDLLLWIGAGAVAAMGLAWLVIAAPWSAPAVPATAATDATAAASSESGAASDPLRMARLALEAGMLIEPDRYSAWSLYGQALADDPGDATARNGLEQVATALLQRGRTALEQGRYDAAQELADTITARLPGHAGAADLAAAVALATAPPPAPPAPPARPASAPAGGEPAAPRATAETRIAELHAAFRDAMAANAVLAPAGTSARDVVNEMVALAPEHELTESARDLLTTEMLDRSGQSLEALDVEAARTWIDAALPLARDPTRVDQARMHLTDHLIAAESQRLLPISELTRTHYAAPEFPFTALSRGIEGWVDIEFTVSPEGRTENVAVTDASHQRYFREEAVAAVAAWEFEPAIFMDRAIARRSYTRVAFVIE